MCCYTNQQVIDTLRTCQISAWTYSSTAGRAQDDGTLPRVVPGCMGFCMHAPASTHRFLAA